MHFLNISISERGRVCQLDFAICFAPQLCALFQELDFQKLPETLNYLHVSLRRMLRATKACLKCSNLWCFRHFDFEMCFPPLWRALFWHLNFQKWSEREVLCTFWLGNVLCATAARYFSSLIPEWLCARCFSEPIFRSSGTTSHWKNREFRDFSTFSRACVFFLLILSFLWSSSVAFFVFWLAPPLSIAPYCRKFDF